VWPERRADGASKLKLATRWNAAGMFVVAVLAAFASVSTDASAMLVSSYYSDQIIITTDERRSGPVDLPPEVGPSIAACWRAPHEGDQITVQLSFRRDGSIFGKPRVNYMKPIYEADEWLEHSGADRDHLPGDRCVPAAPVHAALGRQHRGTGLRHPLCRAVIVGATDERSS
jgi:hypothetical protein